MALTHVTGEPVFTKQNETDVSCAIDVTIRDEQGVTVYVRTVTATVNRFNAEAQSILSGLMATRINEELAEAEDYVAAKASLGTGLLEAIAAKVGE